MNNLKHRHRPVRSKQEVRPFFGPVARVEKPAAHGNVCMIDRCRCGAMRRTNVNGLHVEQGRWIEWEA
jgi:hypothetical protein